MASITANPTAAITTSNYLFENSRSFSSYRYGCFGQHYVVGNIWKIFFTHGLPLILLSLLFGIPFAPFYFFPIFSIYGPLIFVPTDGVYQLFTGLTLILAYFTWNGSICYYVAMIYAGDDERNPSVIESIKHGYTNIGNIVLFLMLILMWFIIAFVVGLIPIAVVIIFIACFIACFVDIGWVVVAVMLFYAVITCLCVGYMMMMLTIPIIIIEDKIDIEAMKRVVYLIRKLSFITTIGTFIFHWIMMFMIWSLVDICTGGYDSGYIGTIITTHIFAFLEPVFFTVLYMLLRIGGDENLNETDFLHSFSNKHHPNVTTSIDTNHDADQCMIPLVVLSGNTVVTDSMSEQSDTDNNYKAVTAIGIV